MPSELAAQPRPRVIDASFWLWLGACLAGMITAAVTLRYFGELQAVLLALVERQFPQETPETREKAAVATVATLIGAGVLLILVQMALAITMRSGRGWARAALLLCTLLGALYGVALFSSAPPLSRVGLVTTTVLMVIAMGPMFLPGTRTWFAQQRLARSSGYGYGE
jgi:hypothetical protein